MALSPGFWQDSALREWTKSHDPNVAPDASHPLIFIAAEHDNERAASILLSAEPASIKRTTWARLRCKSP